LYREAPRVARTPVAAGVECHGTITPSIVSDRESGAHSENQIDCFVCRGDGHTSDYDVEKVQIPAPDTCKACHSTQVEQFSKGKHALAWAAMKAMPAFHNPDYATWYGWAAMKKALTEIKYMDAEMRARHSE
jgi:hypothetical protein